MNYSNSERNKFIDNLRIDIGRNLIVQIEKEIECDIVKAIVLQVIKLRESDINIKDLLDYRIENYPVSDGYFHLGNSVEDNIEEITEVLEIEYIKNYITYCITFNLYPEYLRSELSFLIEEDRILTDIYQVEEFIEDLMERENLKLDYKEFSIIKEDKPIEELLDKYGKEIVKYKLAVMEYKLLNQGDYPVITDYIFSDSKNV